MKLKLMGPFIKFITGGWAAAITLLPFGIYFKKQIYLDNLYIVNHEKIHWAQQTEMLIAGAIMSLISIILMIIFGWSLWWLLLYIPFPFLFFYIEYILEWVLKLFTYDNLSTEREANAHENDLNYLKTRKPFAWLKYIFK